MRTPPICSVLPSGRDTRETRGNGVSAASAIGPRPRDRGPRCRCFRSALVRADRRAGVRVVTSKYDQLRTSLFQFRKGIGNVRIGDVAVEVDVEHPLGTVPEERFRFELVAVHVALGKDAEAARERTGPLFNREDQ